MHRADSLGLPVPKTQAFMGFFGWRGDGINFCLNEQTTLDILALGIYDDSRRTFVQNLFLNLGTKIRGCKLLAGLA